MAETDNNLLQNNIANKTPKQEDNTSFQQVTSPPASDLISQAEAVAKRIEEANKRTEELVARNEAAVAQRILGGKSEAGQAAPVVSEEDKLKEETKKYFKGTIVASMIK